MGTGFQVRKHVMACLKEHGLPGYNIARQSYLRQLHERTGRNTIVYVSGWLVRSGNPFAASINYADLLQLMELVEDMEGGELDLVIHSPGGVVEVAGSLVSFLRSRFDDIRVVVPHLAMSAATMIACAADRIFMGDHSFLGPTDPQMIYGNTQFPAKSLAYELDVVRQAVQKSGNLAVYWPLMDKLQQGQLYSSQQAIAQSKEYVTEWLKKYMLKDNPARESLAVEIADWLTDQHRSHAKHISRSELEERKLVIERFEDDPETARLVMSVYHASWLTLAKLNKAYKLIENHHGRRFWGIV